MLHFLPGQIKGSSWFSEPHQSALLSRVSSSTFVCILCWFPWRWKLLWMLLAEARKPGAEREAVLFLSTHSTPRDVIVVIIDCLINQRLLPVNHTSCSKAQQQVQLPHSRERRHQCLYQRHLFSPNVHKCLHTLCHFCAKLLHFLLL